MFAVHNLWSPVTSIDAAGTYTHDGIARIKAGAPLFTAESFDEAEEWRQRELAKVLAR
ncbi:hypothetical protein [Sphingomonas crocodyli]|uniref:hypothetical protein n=1 Tax=Sphingomonas crocodyli TaxID=1979270 RepID=UPI0013E37147|nr:hypothetical protein [Sphingomonas crocodyli]